MQRQGHANVYKPTVESRSNPSSSFTLADAKPPLTVNLVDLGVLRQNLVCQFLCSRQHLSVVDRYQILDELLQLVSAHLEQGLRDGQVQLDLLGLPHSVKRQRHHVGTVEDVFVAAGARHRCDLAAVEADADAAHELWGRGRGGVCHCAAQMET